MAALHAAWGPGQALAAFVGGLIMAAYGWRAMCVLFGLFTLAWLLPWGRVDLGSAKQAEDRTSRSVPLREILEKKAVWVCCAAHFCNNYGFYFLITWLPLYLVGERGLSIELMATLTGLSFAMQAISALVSGWLSDQIVIRGVAESRVRKSFQVCGNIGKGLSIFGIVRANSQMAMTAWLLLAGVSFGVAGSQNFAVSQLFAGPAAAGRWVGLQNGAGNVAGIIGPVITGLVIDFTGDYWAAFALAGVITFLAAVFWGFVLLEIHPVQWRTAAEPTAT